MAGMMDSGEGASGAVEIDPQGAVIASNEVRASQQPSREF